MRSLNAVARGDVMLIITDIDGTIADDRHRHHHLKNDLVGFFDNSDEDEVNKPGLDLIEELLSRDTGGMKPIIAALTARPSRYTNHKGVRVDYHKRTKLWLANHGLRVDEINMRAANAKKDGYDDKLERFIEVVLEHMEERTIYYLENDQYLAYAAKERCPTTHVYLVTYHGYHEIHTT
jgi:hypothetical protein